MPGSALTIAVRGEPQCLELEIGYATGLFVRCRFLGLKLQDRAGRHDGMKYRERPGAGRIVEQSQGLVSEPGYEVELGQISGRRGAEATPGLEEDARIGWSLVKVLPATRPC